MTLLANSVQADAERPAVMVLGDSISAAYGMTLEQGWVNLLQKRLDAENFDYQVVNASISGDTTGGGLNRLPALLEKHSPKVVILELGGNDGLRGYPIKTLRDNLSAMTHLSRETGAAVLLLPMEVPPNLGSRYTRMFRESFPMVASEHDARVGRFLLDGVATHPALMQADGIHPTAEAQGRLLDNVWPDLEPLL